MLHRVDRMRVLPLLLVTVAACASQGSEEVTGGMTGTGGKSDDGNYIVRYHNQITHGRTALIALRHNPAGTVNEALDLVDSLFSEEDLQPGLGAV